MARVREAGFAGIEVVLAEEGETNLESTKDDMERIVTLSRMLELASCLGVDTILVIPGAVDVFFKPGAEKVSYEVVYERADELIADKDVDLVSVCLPTHLHAEFAIKALKKGKHVFCEKPMAGSLEECDSMIEVAEKAGRKLMIGQCLRFWPEYELLKDYVENGKLGKLTGLFCFRGGGTPIWSAGNWLLQKDKSGGVLLDQHIHDIDTVNFLMNYQ